MRKVHAASGAQEMRYKIAMSDIAINQVIAQMRSVQALAQGQGVGYSQGADAVSGAQFSNLSSSKFTVLQIGLSYLKYCVTVIKRFKNYC